MCVLLLAQGGLLVGKLSEWLCWYVGRGCTWWLVVVVVIMTVFIITMAGIQVEWLFRGFFIFSFRVCSCVCLHV